MTKVYGDTDNLAGFAHRMTGIAQFTPTAGADVRLTDNNFRVLDFMGENIL
jgi:hypothetical protein